MEWFWIIGAARAGQKWLKRMFGKSPKVHIRIEPGGVYNDFRGASGEFHVHLPGGTEIESPIPIVVHEYERTAHEQIAIKEEWSAKLTKEDGTVETYGSDKTEEK